MERQGGRIKEGKTRRERQGGVDKGGGIQGG